MMADGQRAYSEITYNAPEEWKGRCLPQRCLPQPPPSQPPPSDDWKQERWVEQGTSSGWWRCLACAKWITNDHLQTEAHESRVLKWKKAHEEVDESTRWRRDVLRTEKMEMEKVAEEMEKDSTSREVMEEMEKVAEAD